jgi:hypothetical protein
LKRIKSALIAVRLSYLFLIEDIDKGVQTISINNGVILCAFCADQHQRLGPNISFLRPIAADFWNS